MAKRSPSRALTPEQKKWRDDRIVQLKREGLTNKAIAERMSASYDVVRTVLGARKKEIVDVEFDRRN